MRDCTIDGVVGRDTRRGVEIWLPKHNSEGQIDPPRSDTLREPPGMIPFALENVRFSNMDLTCRRAPISVIVAPEIKIGHLRDVSFSHCRFKAAQPPKFNILPKDRLVGWTFDDVAFEINGLPSADSANE